MFELGGVKMFECDELSLYAGDDIEITDKIIVTQPTLKQIRKFGEKRYFNAVYTLTSVGADLKWQLWEMGQDYTKIEDYDLFIQFISQAVASKKQVYKELTKNKDKHADLLKSLSEKDLKDMQINPMQLVLKDIDFADFIPMKVKYAEGNDQIILYDPKKDITIDRVIYSQIVDVVRKIHGFKRNNQIPANEATKMDLIEDSRDEAIMASKKPYKSIILPLLSTLKVDSGQCGNRMIWDMKINEFFYDIKRFGKIDEARRLLQGACSGFASLKDIDKNRLDMFAEI